MIRLTPFEVLLVTHLVMDWIFQTKWEALNKAERWFPLTVHCVVYTLGFIPAFLFFQINLSWLIFIFLSHIIIDQRKFELWLTENFKGLRRATVPESLWWIVLIGVDQTLHLVILAIILLF